MYKTEFLALTKLAVPLIIAQLAQTTISFVDTLMVGALGKDALAGIAIGSTAFFSVFVVASGLVLGVGPVVSHAVGANDQETVGRAARQGLWLSVIVFIPAFILFWNIYPLLILLGQPADLAAVGRDYLRAISWGLLPGLGIMSLRGLLEGTSNSRPIMLISFLGVGLNIFLNNVLMFGWYGLPALGLVGTGYASSLVYGLMFVMLAVYIHYRYPELHVFSRIRTPDPAMIGELIRVGAPIGLILGFEMSMFSAAAFAMGNLGKNELAAHQIAIQTASISFMVPLGIAIASSVRVGQAIGRGAPREAEIAGYVGMAACVGVMSVSAIAFWIVPHWIIGLYIDISNVENQSVVKLATGFLAIAALFQLFDGLQVSGSSALRGLKDTTAAMVLTLIAYWGIGSVAGASLCYGLDYRGNGLWFGMTLGLAAAALLLSMRFRWQIRRQVREKAQLD